jgi:cytochrome c oxidase subunit I+III
MILFAFPPLIVGDLLLELERLLDWPFFDAARGGDPLLWQHLFWIFGHPEVYIVFLPAMALTAMIVPTFAGRPIVGYPWVVLAALGIGFLSFGLWVHHMYATGLPALSLGFFSAASEAVAIPTGIQIFCFIATLLAGRVVRSVPLLFVLGGLAIFVLGGLTGVMVALVPFDLQAHDTFFVVGHLHYVLIGGTIFPILGAIHYYFPRAFGRQLSPSLGRIAFWTIFVGFHVTFLPMHLTGLRGMPRRVFTYPAGVGFDALNLVSSVGAFILAAGFAVFVLDVVRPRRGQPRAERNPWRAGTLEWLTRIPVRPWGVRSIPRVHTRYPLWEQAHLARDVDEGRFYLADAPEGLRETLVTSPLDAHPTQCLRVPGPTWIAMLAALGTGGAFIFATFHVWWAAAASGLLALGAILRWLWTGTARIPAQEEKDVGMGVVLPTYRSGPDAVGWWAMFITMVGDLAAFGGLLFGYFFYWTVNADFPPAGFGDPGVLWPAVALGLVLGSWALTLAARRLNRVGRGRVAAAALVLALALAGGGGAAGLAGPWLGGMDPTLHVYPAIVWILVIWLAAHLALGALMQGYCVARWLAGHLDARHDIDLANVTLYWHFVALTAAVALGVVATFPRVS